MNRFRLPIFAGNLVEFHGFEACELAHMQEVLVANGGEVTRSPAERTHLVVNEHSVEVLPASLEVSEGCHLVKGEWICWTSPFKILQSRLYRLKKTRLEKRLLSYPAWSVGIGVLMWKCKRRTFQNTRERVFA